MTNEDQPLGGTFSPAFSPIEQPSRLDPSAGTFPTSQSESASFEPRSGNEGSGSGAKEGSGGGNEGEIPWPEKGHPFWQWPDETKVEWLMDRQAEQRFDQGLDHYLAEAYRDRGEVPENVKQAISQLAWSMLIQNRPAYGWLRDDGKTLVVEHFVDKANAYIQKLATEFEDYKPGRPLDRMIENLGPKSDYQRTLKDLRRAEAPRPRGPARPDRRTLDQSIADLGNRNLTDDEAIGRYGSNR
jgi:hypothetical protein